MVGRAQAQEWKGLVGWGPASAVQTQLTLLSVPCGHPRGTCPSPAQMFGIHVCPAQGPLSTGHVASATEAPGFSLAFVFIVEMSIALGGQWCHCGWPVPVSPLVTVPLSFLNQTSHCFVILSLSSWPTVAALASPASPRPWRVPPGLPPLWGPQTGFGFCLSVCNPLNSELGHRDGTR